MVRYQSFTFPAKYKKLTKDELFTEFMKKNVFLMATPTLYSKNMFDILKTVVLETDDNEITWWKFWLKTESIMAQMANLFYMEETIEKILENISLYTTKELVHVILDFNIVFINLKELDIFPNIESNIHLFCEKKDIPESINFCYKNRAYISKILNKYIPEEAINKKIIKAVVGDYLFNNLKSFDNTIIMQEFLYKEVLAAGELNQDCITEVCSKFITRQYKKNHPSIVDDIWKEIEDIKNNSPSKK